MRPVARIAGITALAMATPASAATLMLDSATTGAPFQTAQPPTWHLYQNGDYPAGPRSSGATALFDTQPEFTAGYERRHWPPPSEAPEIAAGANETRRSGGWLPLIGGVLLVAYRMRRARGRTRFTSAV